VVLSQAKGTANGHASGPLTIAVDTDTDTANQSPGLTGIWGV